jgi:sugar O-acyltransferase (sialic acid O-acetyltransferase NeuD family)
MKIVLAGAGAFALEIEQYILNCKSARSGLFDAEGRQPTYGEVAIAGVYFTGPGRLEDFQTRPIEMSAAPRAWSPELHFLIAIGNAEARRKVWNELDGGGARFATLVHPSCVVAANARLGAGTILGPFSFVGPLAKVGRNAALNTYASVGHDASVGDHTVFSPYSCVNGFVSIGETCFLGSGAIVSPQHKVGAFSKIAAGSIVSSDFDPGSLVHGNPAKARRMFRIPADFAG